MKIVLPMRRPRNPLVAAALTRKAGSHRPSQAAQRQRQHRATRRAIEDMTRSP